MKILIIEDNPEIIGIVAQTLELRWPEAGLISTSSGKEGVELVKKELPDIVILDLGLPDMDGFQVLRQIRGFSDVFVVILSVRGEEGDRIRGLEDGADDYMVKPFSPGELVARLKALLRRSQMCETAAKAADKPPIKGKLRIDSTSQTVSVGDKLLKLSPREYELLDKLVTNEGVVLSSRALLKEVFPEQSSDIRYLEVYIKKLRERLEEDPGNPKMILNEGRTGYRFVNL